MPLCQPFLLLYKNSRNVMAWIWIWFGTTTIYVLNVECLFNYEWCMNSETAKQGTNLNRSLSYTLYTINILFAFPCAFDHRFLDSLIRNSRCDFIPLRSLFFVVAFGFVRCLFVRFVSFLKCKIQFVSFVYSLLSCLFVRWYYVQIGESSWIEMEGEFVCNMH